MRQPNIFIRPSHTEIRVIATGLTDDDIEIVQPQKIVVEVLTGLDRSVSQIVDIADLVNAWEKAQS